MYMTIVCIPLPANRSCGTNRSGANSVTSLTLLTAAPNPIATDELASDSIHVSNTRRIKFPCKSIK